MWTLSGGAKLKLSKDIPLFFDGNVRINCGSGVVGEGFIVATGNIIFNTGEVTATAGDDGGLVDKEKKTIAGVGLYSVGGNVEFAVGGSEFSGLIYAPKGTVNLQTKDMTINGSVVGKEVITKTNGINITYKDTSAHETITETETENSHLITAKDVIGKFVNSFDSKDAKIGILTYQNDANTNTFDLLDVDGAKGLIGGITASKEDSNNLGDGLRRAYYLLKDKGSKSSDKYIVVLSCADPNKCTLSGLGETGEYKTVAGNAVNILPALNVTKGTEYAKEILGKINEDTEANIKTHFVDFRFGEDLAKIKEIAESGTNYYNPTTDNELEFPGKLEATMNSISTEILGEKNYIDASDVIVTAEFEDYFPTSVNYVAPTSTPVFGVEVDNAGTVDDTSDDRYKIKKSYSSGTIDVQPYGDKFRVKIKDEEFKPSRVRFMSLGDKLFNGGSIKFKIKNADGTEITKILETEKSGSIENVVIEVLSSIDIR